MSVRIGYTDPDFVLTYRPSTGFEDVTQEVLSGCTVLVFDGGEADSAFYIGHRYNRWEKMVLNVAMGMQAFSACVLWEYFQAGSTWTPIPSVLDNTAGFTLTGLRSVLSTSAIREDRSTQYGECGGEESIRPGWERATINGSTGFFWRARLASVSGFSRPAAVTSASIDLTLPSPLPEVRVEKLGELITTMCGTRYLYQNGYKRTYRMRWENIDVFDAMSARERAYMAKVTELTFPDEWFEDENPVCCVIDPRGYTDDYQEDGSHNVTLVFLEV